ncbi:MAG: iron-sulfur cluster carrier protein ApbC [Gammaproteobacteria bacterium]|nr:iron-sulfur cluster carrier protein ApbC [Gammaproteobacteria bacterium]NIN61014.1 iron-sulfur cluster carrier protein ApbC [Gammaproteobacteria bacterium]NIO62637.1 iron-sulfur cluster carrier protein ApbC [Gammaproteobacteria bacterium]NIP49446.1 iron-sulfur cluster carrier protein ApbC [Gammaproteobacteria bacterium]NIQ10670.1 iron-sulfur cluster carrier protein ApbC [Gammaproteobacteria bacterium]
MSELTPDIIESSLGQIVDLYTGEDLASSHAIKSVKHDGTPEISIELGYPAKGYHEKFKEIINSKLQEDFDISGARISISSHIIAHSVQKGVQVLPNIKNTIAVASGKGGVGKSTTAVNLALALQAEGAKVGILDADIYGPSQPRMLGCHGKPDTKDGKTVEPNISYGLQSMSIGYLIEEDTPMIWRGPMVTSALEQLLNDTNWVDLDYLVIDLPPGTGDIQLTLCQKIPVSGAIIVTTPQDIALLDAKKALKMFEKVEVSVLGIVENMSTHICSQCGHEEHIFGAGGGEQMAAQYGVDLLGSLPLDISIREGVDSGKPTVALAPDSVISLTYREIARKAAAKLALQAKDYSHVFPKIVVDKN